MALIPSDAGLRMRLDNELLPQQVSPVQEVAADLPRLQAGQLFTAQIREVLPQNTYLALVAGKQVTLSLPENVKSGDVLELVVVDQTPKAVIAALASQTATTAGETATPQTTLSQAAQMLRSLLVSEGDTPEAAPLNRGQPLLAQPPQTGAELAPVLSKAVSESGLFYEAHQAQWVAGKLPLANLRQEPQGQIPTPAQTPFTPPAATLAAASAESLVAAQTLAPGQTAPTAAANAPIMTPGLPAAEGTVMAPAMSAPAAPTAATSEHRPTPPGAAAQTPVPLPLNNAVANGILLYQTNQAHSPAPNPPGTPADTPDTAPHTEAGAATPTHKALPATNASNASNATDALTATTTPPGRPEETQAARPQTGIPSQMQTMPAVPDDLRALVQQQLDAAGTQRLLWHGEVWPGQTMHWQLEWRQQGGGGEEAEAEPWQTKLRLTTPRLGTLEASLQLGPAGVRIALSATDDSSAEEMRAGVADLDSALSAAGVPLLGFTVRQAREEEET